MAGEIAAGVEAPLVLHQEVAALGKSLREAQQAIAEAIDKQQQPDLEIEAAKSQIDSAQQVCAFYYNLIKILFIL